MPRVFLGLLALLVLPWTSACGEEVLLHRLDEAQANQVLVALGDDGVTARKGRDDGDETAFEVAVRHSEASRARSVLAVRDLPRARSPGFTDLFGSPGLVPSPLEEHARYLHALSGELSRTVEAFDGVIGARVHLSLPVQDPLRPEVRKTPRASVLVKCRPDARARIEEQADGLRRIVAGAAEGLEPAAVAIVVAESAPPPARPPERAASRSWLAGSALAFAVLLGAGALLLERRRPDVR
jgi:type III secretion protein J